MNVIYLDNNATTKVAPEVVDAMLPYLSEYYGNPSSMHSFGGDVAAHIKQARENVANLIGATADEIVFTSCGTEARRVTAPLFEQPLNPIPTENISSLPGSSIRPSKTCMKPCPKKATALPSCR